MAAVDGQPKNINSRLENLRNLAPAERMGRVANATSLGDVESAAFSPGALPIALANGMIENVIGTFELPIGIAVVVRDPFGNVLTMLDQSKGTFTTDAAGNVTGVEP